MPDEVLLELPDVLAHRRVLVRMSPCPPHQVMEIAAELIERAIRRNDLQSMIKRRSALAADSSSDLDRLIVAVPGNPAVTALVKSGGIDGSDGPAGVRVPVLARGPMVGGNWDSTNPAEWQLILVGCGVPPFAPVAAVESACSTVVRSAVGHDALLDEKFLLRLP